MSSKNNHSITNYLWFKINASGIVVLINFILFQISFLSTSSSLVYTPWKKLQTTLIPFFEMYSNILSLLSDVRHLLPIPAYQIGRNCFFFQVFFVKLCYETNPYCNEERLFGIIDKIQFLFCVELKFLIAAD